MIYQYLRFSSWRLRLVLRSRRPERGLVKPGTLCFKDHNKLSARALSPPDDDLGWNRTGKSVWNVYGKNFWNEPHLALLTAQIYLSVITVQLTWNKMCDLFLRANLIQCLKSDENVCAIFWSNKSQQNLKRYSGFVQKVVNDILILILSCYNSFVRCLWKPESLHSQKREWSNEKRPSI